MPRGVQVGYAADATAPSPPTATVPSRRRELPACARGLRLVEQPGRHGDVEPERFEAGRERPQVLGLHALARGAELPRPERVRRWHQDQDRRRAQPGVSVVYRRPDRLSQTPPGRRARSRPAIPSRQGAAADDSQVHARARPKRLPRSDDDSAEQPSRLQHRARTQRCVSRDPQFDRRAITGLQASRDRVPLRWPRRRSLTLDARDAPSRPRPSSGRRTHAFMPLAAPWRTLASRRIHPRGQLGADASFGESTIARLDVFLAECGAHIRTCRNHPTA
jgi:hypothetical protein